MAYGCMQICTAKYLIKIKNSCTIWCVIAHIPYIKYMYILLLFISDSELYSHSDK